MAGCTSPFFRTAAPIPIAKGPSRVVRSLPTPMPLASKQPEPLASAPADDPPKPEVPATPIPTPRPTTTPRPENTGGGGSGSGNGGVVTPVSNNLGLRGLITLPGRLLSESGSSLISNNGSTLLSNNGAAIVSNNGGRLISNNGAAIIANNGARYRLMQDTPAEPQRPLTNAFLYLSDRDERFFLDANQQAFAATVDTNGKYQFAAGYPVDKPVIVNAVTNASLRLVGFVIPNANGTEFNINLGTTLATEYLRGVSYRQQKSLREYDYSQFTDVAQRTQNAILSRAITSIEVVADQTGTNTTVGVFDLRADNTRNLRNQYALAISVVDVGDAVIRALSDAWKNLTGVRPSAVTSVIGNGQEPQVGAGGNFINYGAAEGNDLLSGEPTPRNQIPLGFNFGLATARGHTFISCYTRAGASGHIRWLKPDGSVTSIWLPTYGFATPVGLAVETPPSDDPNNPGTLIVSDLDRRAVFRVPIVDVRESTAHLVEVPCTGDSAPSSDIEKLSMEYVAGEAVPDPFIFADCQSYLNQLHPFVIRPELGGSYQTSDNSSPLRSNWRYGDEGDRRYTPGGAQVPKAARYAHLDSPYDVTVDSLGNIYIADFNNQRIRFIPSARALTEQSNYFNYRTPALNSDQEIQGLGAAPAMIAGAIYTIAGNPVWDPANTPQGATGWLGDFAGDGGPAQLAKIDKPAALAFNEQDQCLYFADSDNCRIRKIDRNTGIITTIAGSATTRRNNGRGDIDMTPGYSGDGGPAAAAELAFPYGIAFDAQNRLFIADNANGVIRMVANDSQRTITTVAGRNRTANSIPATLNDADGDARFYADFYNIQKMAFDPDGNLLINDVRSGRLRKIWRQWD